MPLSTVPYFPAYCDVDHDSQVGKKKHNKTKLSTGNEKTVSLRFKWIYQKSKNLRVRDLKIYKVWRYKLVQE